MGILFDLDIKKEPMKCVFAHTSLARQFDCGWYFVLGGKWGHVLIIICLVLIFSII